MCNWPRRTIRPAIATLSGHRVGARIASWQASRSASRFFHSEAWRLLRAGAKLGLSELRRMAAQARWTATRQILATSSLRAALAAGMQGSSETDQLCGALDRFRRIGRRFPGGDCRCAGRADGLRTRRRPGTDSRSRRVRFDDQRRVACTKRGDANALRNADVIKATLSGLRGRIALAYFEWASPDDQRLIMPWTVIDGPDSARSFADALKERPIGTYLYGGLQSGRDFDLRRALIFFAFVSEQRSPSRSSGR